MKNINALISKEAKLDVKHEYAVDTVVLHAIEHGMYYSLGFVTYLIDECSEQSIKETLTECLEESVKSAFDRIALDSVLAAGVQGLKDDMRNQRTRQ